MCVASLSQMLLQKSCRLAVILKFAVGRRGRLSRLDDIRRNLDSALD